MPALRRRVRLRRESFEELSWERRRHLVSGRGWFDDNFPDLESFTAAWEIHRDELLAEHIQKDPCTRPFAWWVCDHKKELPIIASWATPEEIALARSLIPPEHFGYLWGETFGAGEYFQQREHDYLAEHGLLTADELVVFAKGMPDACYSKRSKKLI